MISVPKLEMHLAHACNLRCDGCTHYADHALPGLVRLADGGQWLRSWSERITPVNFTFLGGEPLINAETGSYLRLARTLWPRTRLRLVTNGLLLDRRPSLWDVLAETRTTLTVSIHSRAAWYTARITPVRELARSHAASDGFVYEERDATREWYKLYRGHGASMEPFDDGDPAASWRVCRNKHCVTLQDNALWKCPPLAHLGRVAAKHGLAERASWQPYLRYEPLTLATSDEELVAFFARREERFCGMCPTRLEFFEKSVS